MIVGYTFSGLSYPSPAFARFIDTVLDEHEGIIKGADVQVGNTQILVEEGDFIIKGRHFKVIGNETVDFELPASGTLFGLLIAEIDLTKESSLSNFAQVEFKILTSAQNYPNVTQQDINSEDPNNTLYQYAMGQFKLNSNGIFDYKDLRTFLDFDSIYDEIRRHIEDIDDGSIFALKSQIQANILYTNPGDSRENPALNDDITKYKRIDIQYSDGTVKNAISFYDVKVGDQLQLDIWAAVRNQSNQLRYAFATTIVDTERTIVYRDYLSGFITNSNVTYYGTKDVRIDKIIGYKEY